MTHSFDAKADSIHPPRRRGRWLIGGGLLVLPLLIAWGMHHAYYRHRGGTELQRALAELDRTDSSWRLRDLEEARAVVPDAENSALVATTAANLLPSNWPPNAVVEAFDKLSSQVLLDDEQAALLRKELDERRRALEIARKLAGMPTGRHPIEYRRNPLETLLPSQQKVRATTHLLQYDAFLRAHDGDLKGALDACRAALNAGRSLGDEPLAVSQLIRIACVVSGCQTVERVLAQGKPELHDLERLQRLLQEEDAHPTQAVVWRGERALQEATFEALESGQIKLDQMVGGLNLEMSPVDRLTFRFRVSYPNEHAFMLSLMNRGVATTQLPPHQQAAAEKEITAEVRRLADKTVLIRLLFPALEKVSEASRGKQAHVRCLLVALAVERYRHAHGQWPETLKQLVPEPLSDVPLDPFDGAPLRYRRLADGVIVYSVGVDGVDNGGTLDRDNPLRAGTDLGYRLWDVRYRRQPPKAKPVDPVEGK
jgi:hypothetical protein